MSEEYNVRRGKGVKWRMVSHTCAGTREVTGFTIDNLDSKKLPQAENTYESVFITIREELEKLSSHCMDEESERLSACQSIADALRSGGLI